MLNNVFLKLLNFLGSAVIVIILLSSGFYFGYQAGAFNTKKENEKVNKNTNQTVKEFIATSSQNSSSESNQVSKSISQTLLINENIKFFKPNDSNHVCPNNLAVKGVFTSDNGFFYTKDNKSYDRVKADICFDTVETARDIVGFIQKF